MRTCDVLCERLADCLVQICNEDTSSDHFAGLEDVLMYSCTPGCSDAKLQSGYTDADWACIFTASCREFIDYDACDLDMSYTCDDPYPSERRPSG